MCVDIAGYSLESKGCVLCLYEDKKGPKWLIYSLAGYERKLLGLENQINFAK